MKRKKGKGWSKAKIIKFDGISFKSGLEKYCYMQLKKAKLFDKYEEESFELMTGFPLDNEVYERQSNGKGEYKKREGKIRSISYTPDFTGEDYIIETKGYANPTFPVRYKLFKQWVYLNNDSRMLLKPQNQKEVDLTITLILDSRRK